MGDERFTVGSLFSGIGGFDLGFEWAGFRTAWFCESDEFCRRVLAKHWPGVPCYPDVRTLRMADAKCPEWRAAAERRNESNWHDAGRDQAASGFTNRSHGVAVDCLIGGFPCQDVSDAGQRAGLDGLRSGLWWEFARCVREFRPRVVVVENVAGLFVRGFGDVLGELAACGYDCEWTSLRASDVGAPHRRERVFIIAYRLADAAELHGDASNIYREHGAGDFSEFRDSGGTEYGTRWPARPGERQHDWEPPRTIASARAQSAMGELPDGISGGLPGWRRASLAALGNAVVPQCAYVVACRVRAILEGQ